MSDYKLFLFESSLSCLCSQQPWFVPALDEAMLRDGMLLAVESPFAGQVNVG